MARPSEREIIKALSFNRTFVGLDGDDFSPFLAETRLELFAEGAPLTSRGDVSSSGYILVSGCVELTTEHMPGRRASRQHFAAGTLISGAALIKDWPQDQECVAVQETYALELTRSGFKKLLNTGNNVAFRLLDELLEGFVARVSAANQLVDDIYSHPDETLLLLRARAASETNPG